MVPRVVKKPYLSRGYSTRVNLLLERIVLVFYCSWGIGELSNLKFNKFLDARSEKRLFMIEKGNRGLFYYSIYDIPINRMSDKNHPWQTNDNHGCNSRILLMKSLKYNKHVNFSKQKKIIFIISFSFFVIFWLKKEKESLIWWPDGSVAFFQTFKFFSFSISLPPPPLPTFSSLPLSFSFPLSFSLSFLPFSFLLRKCLKISTNQFHFVDYFG